MPHLSGGVIYGFIGAPHTGITEIGELDQYTSYSVLHDQVQIVRYRTLTHRRFRRKYLTERRIAGKINVFVLFSVQDKVAVEEDSTAAASSHCDEPGPFVLLRSVFVCIERFGCMLQDLMHDPRIDLGLQAKGSFKRHSIQHPELRLRQKEKKMTKAVNLVLTILILGIFSVPGILAQTSEISYQGSLKDGAALASGNYDIEFRLYDAASGGLLIGTEIYLSPVVVTDGVFAVKLDFGAAGFPGQDRYLEIAVRKTGVGSLVTLGPRQKIGSAPYAIQSLQATTATTAFIASNAQALGGVNASQYVVTTDPRMTDPRSPAPGSGNYIQNTLSPQATSNFNISGTGQASIITVSNRFNFGTQHILSANGLDNLFAGANSGLLNLGNNNAFFGAKSGQENKQGQENSFFGSYAGQNNVTGNGNSFFGYFAGNATTTGNENSFFGNRSGQVNTSGAFNSFFGTFSGFFNTTGSDNSFFGNSSGYNTTGGNRNSFFGSQTGRLNVGDDNAFLGSFAGQANTSGGNNSFVGSLAGQANATGINNSFMGSRAGHDNTASNNSFFGTEAGRFNTTGANNTFLGRNAGHDNTAGELNVFIGVNAGTGNQLGRLNTIVGAEANVLGTNLSYATAIGAEAIVNSSNTIVLGRTSGADAVRIPGNVNVLGTLSAANLSVQATNITGVIPTANGGTGLSSPGTAGRFLRSDGTNWVSSLFTAGDVPQGSGFYVQNGTTQQGSTNFNISGNGTAGGTFWGNAINSSTQYSIGGNRVLIANGSNLFTGLTAGNANTTGTSNSFVGNSAGSLNTSGAGNAFFGTSAGLNSSTGGNNTFSGFSSGSGNTLGSNNSFFGVNAGQTNTLGSNNTTIGANANVGSANLSYATAIGADAVASTSNSVVLGRSVDAVRIPGNLQVDGNLIANSFPVNASNITGTVAVANGGTGMAATGAAGNYLRSNGSIWQSSAIAAGDIPAGSLNYIQNGLAQQPTANFNIGGAGTVGGAFTANSVNSETAYRIGGTSVLSNTGSSNIFVGAGTAATGTGNSFFGFGSGAANTTGFSNTLLGSGTNVGAGNLSFATAVGAGSTVSNNNSVVLGRGADTVRVPGDMVITGTLTAPSFTVSAANITGLVGTANGGTGLGSAGTTGNFLRSNGSGWASQGLLASDLPGGSTSYIQNGAGQQSGATFNIGGNGTIGGNLSVGGTITGAFSVPAANITGLLGAPQGGTGLNASTGTNFLRGNGTGGWTSAALAAGDLPAGSTSYVQNTTTAQPGVNFNIGGNGTIGGGLTVAGPINGSLAASNLTGTVGISNGGTGLTSAGTSGHFVKSTGTGFATSPLTAGEIPDLSATYVRNSSSAQTGANFNIGGNGTVGTDLNVGGNLSVGGTITGSFSVPATNITGTLGVANGGTGLGSAGTSGHFVKSTGSGFTTAALTAGELPAGSTSYIQNGTAPQAGTSFSVDGSGAIGTNLSVGGTAGFSSNVSVGGNLSVTGSITGSFSVPAANVTGTFGAGQGGTGLSSSTATNFLRGNGSGGWTSGGLTAGDLPTGSSNYIQNTPGAPQAGGFDVAGSGKIGTNLNVGGNASVAADLSVSGDLNVAGSITGVFSVPAGNITGTLGVANGGTGLGSAGTSGHFVKSTGTGFTTAALTASELPAGSTSYIQNGTSPQTGTSFSVDGSGAVGTNLTVGGNATVTGGLTVNGAFNGSFTVPAANITGTIGAGAGGTGLSSSTGSEFLRGNGSGGWTSSALSAGDIPNLGTNYIQNAPGSPQSGSFNVNGSGQVGTTLTVGTTMTANTVNSTTQYNISGSPVLSVTGTNNVFVGAGAGTTGSSNAFFGKDAGNANSTGSGNTVIGASADVGAGNLTNATAVGANATVTQSNSVVLGGVTGENGGTDTNVGIGTTAPKAKLDVRNGDVFVGTLGSGVILKSPNGSCFRLTVSDAGALTAVGVTCPQ